MTREEEIRMKYEKELEDMYREQSACTHEWDEVRYDPEIKQEPASYEYEGAGVDKYPVVTSWKEVKIPRWSRTCKKCGKVEYTKEQVAVKYEPKF